MESCGIYIKQCLGHTQAEKSLVYKIAIHFLVDKIKQKTGFMKIHKAGFRCCVSN